MISGMSTPTTLDREAALTISREELAIRIAAASLLGGNFTLRSGRTSTLYLDKYLFSTDPAILARFGVIA
jgi:orotate phosphoribosyltransferase